MEVNASAGQLFTRLVTLLSAEQEDFLTIASKSYQVTLRGLPELLDYTASVIHDALHECATSEPLMASGNVLDLFLANIEHFNESHANHIDANDASCLATACYFTSAIFRNSASNRHEKHAATQSYVDGLYTAVRRVRDKTWEGVPYLRLLMYAQQTSSVLVSILMTCC